MDSIAKDSVAIILVNWNGAQFSIDCLHSLRKLDFPDFGIFLVDNASDNHEGEELKAEFPEIILIQSSTNLGFAGGNNLGIRKALELGYSHLMLLNNDTVVAPNFLQVMMSQFEKSPSLGVVQPLIYWMKDRNQIWNAGGKWDPTLGRAIPLRELKNGKKVVPKIQNIDWATGCCMLIKREAILQVGLLNEQFFTYFEDVEWSLRFREKGFEIALAPKAFIYHEAGASSKKKHEEGTLSPRVFYYHVRNQFFLIRSTIGRFNKPFAYGYHLIRFGFWIGYFLIRGRFKKLKSVAKGIQEGITMPLQSQVK
ncbi:MAG: GT2 family glycosyltransferase [Algoriphagus sp.]